VKKIIGHGFSTGHFMDMRNLFTSNSNSSVTWRRLLGM